MIEDNNYEEFPELYAQAMLADGNEVAMAEYWENEYGDNSFEELTEMEVEYESPLELLEHESKKTVVELAETQRILNGETGSLAGMNYHHTGAASD